MYLIALSGNIFSFSNLIPNLSSHSFMNCSSFSSVFISFGNPLAWIFIDMNSATYPLNNSLSHFS
ncbi:unnamed protein product [Meloidogyne enterolobii]|uniref:Uncharacterized protein n=1 Tax=Meloidogyne enterolobii TaxID=390850 RepID=A0ACB0Z9K0_MELEN